MDNQTLTGGNPRTQEEEECRENILPHCGTATTIKSKALMEKVACSSKHLSGETRPVSTPDCHRNSGVKTPLQKLQSSNLSPYIDFFTKPESLKDRECTDLDVSLFYTDIPKAFYNRIECPCPRDRGSTRPPVLKPGLPGTPCIMHEPPPFQDFSDSTIFSPEPAQVTVGLMRGSLITQQPSELQMSSLVEESIQSVLSETKTVVLSTSNTSSAGSTMSPFSKNNTFDSCPAECSNVHNGTFNVPSTLRLNATTESVVEADSVALEAVLPSSQNNTFDMAEAAEPSAPCVQNDTIDIPSTPSLNTTTTVVEAGSVALEAVLPSSQNNTFDMAEPSAACVQNDTIDIPFKPSLNTTTTVVEAGSVALEATPASKLSGTFTGLSIGLQNKFDLSSPSELREVTSQDGVTEAQPAELAQLDGVTAGATDAQTALDGFVVEVIAATGSETDTEPGGEISVCSVEFQDGIKPVTFTLDDSLDLRAETVVTSTPMPDAKIINLILQREPAKSSDVQRRLYGDGLGALPPPSNQVADRKMFLTAPTAKSLLPPLKGTSHLMKYRPASAEGPTAGLPRPGRTMTRRALVAPGVVSQETKALPKSSLGRTAVTAPNQSIALKRPRPSGIPATNRKVSQLMRSSVAVSLENPSVSTAAGWSGMPSQAISHAQRSLGTDKDAPLLPKRKKTDVTLSNCTEPPKAPRGLKRPAVGSLKTFPAKTKNPALAKQSDVDKEGLERTTVENGRLKEENGRLKEENGRLKEENGRLREENRRLREGRTGD